MENTIYLNVSQYLAMLNNIIGIGSFPKCVTGSDLVS